MNAINPATNSTLDSLNTPLVIKVGGAIFEQKETLQNLLLTIKKVQQAGTPVVLVHGGGDQVQTQLTQLGLPSHKINGQRITPASHIPTVSGVLAGFLNKSLVATAQAIGINAVGLSLHDGQMCQFKQVPELEQVGYAHANEATFISATLSAGILPIISSIGANSEGQLLNINADSAACAVSELVNGQLIFMSDVEGVLDAEKKLISELNQEAAQALMDTGVIQGGMTIKIKSALSAAKALTHLPKERRMVAVTSWNTPESLLDLAVGKVAGTRVYA